MLEKSKGNHIITKREMKSEESAKVILLSSINILV